MARGLDYYTGIIYEAITEGSAPPPPSLSPTSTPTVQPKTKKSTSAEEEEEEVDESTIGIGSIAAGGRYDNLVGMFSNSSSAAGKIPCVGISFGVERIFSLLLAKRLKQGIEVGRSKKTEVFVISVGEGLLKERIGMCKTLWAAGIKVRPLLPSSPFPLPTHILT